MSTLLPTVLGQEFPIPPDIVQCGAEHETQLSVLACSYAAARTPAGDQLITVHTQKSDDIEGLKVALPSNDVDRARRNPFSYWLNHLIYWQDRVCLAMENCCC